MSKTPVQTYCASCWCAIPKNAPRIVINNTYRCATCVYNAELGVPATNVGVCNA